jgi:NAD+ kinase
MMLNSVAIFSKDTNAKTRESVGRLVDEFCKRKTQVFIHRRNEEIQDQFDGVRYFDDFSEFIILPDLVLSVGGDGTFLETILKVKDYGIPMAGVNTGRMGFLANISTDEISRSIDMINDGQYEIVERCMLEFLKPSWLFEGNNTSALNEVTIQKSDLSMITINVFVNDLYLNTYWSDGLIISTATGSTAYNLSVGGPILSPEDESLIILPLAPHNLTVRPIVISGKSRLRMTVEGRSNEFLATVDFRSKKVPFSEEVHIAQSDVRIKTVMLKGRDFYSTLRNKLMWGVDKRN